MVSTPLARQRIVAPLRENRTPVIAGEMAA
jgi:hypothetical protein